MILVNTHHMWPKMMRIMIGMALLLVTNAHAAAPNATDAAGLAMPEIKRLGERIYRDGLLPDGAVLRGYVRGDVEIDSTMFSCANCHTRSGLGSVEGQVTSPPVNGPSLFNPRYVYKDQVKNSISKGKGLSRPATPIRPAYTATTLAAAIRGGVNPDGRVLLPIMPRYYLEERDMQILIRYLESLSAQHSPGVTADTIRFATIVTDDVSAPDRAAMMGILDTLVTINQQTREQRKQPKFFKMFRMLDNAYFRYITITPWELKGAPATWRDQLEEYYRKEPVFAVLGGISGQSWQPMHDFCEENQIPCLFPLTDLPVISDSSWYTLYASKGYYQEGETAARFLAGSATATPKKVLQLVSATAEAEALATGFLAAWNESGAGGVETIRLSADQKLGPEELQALLKQHGPTALLMWGGSEMMALLDKIEETPEVFVSARAQGKAFWNIPLRLRDRTYLTYPYRLPEDEKKYAGYADILQLGKQKQKDDRRIASRTYSMVHLFLEGLKELRLDFYRDTLLDVIGMMPDQYLPDYERYSFGPGQRYASKGCYIVQLTNEPSAKLVKKSEWVVF